MIRRISLFLAAAALLAAPAARAGDVTAFVAFPQPSENWGRGYGASLSSTWFVMLNFEAEAARLPGEDPAVSMTTFTVSAMVAPPIGFFTPYGGLGIGVVRQSAPNLSDTGSLHALILGGKVKFGPLFLLKAEYRKLNLSGSPLLAATKRYSLGAGITF